MRFFAVWTLLALAPALAPAQSLGEAARREQERRRRVEASGDKARVITESELGANRPATTPATTPAATPAAAPDSGASAGPADGDDGVTRPDDEDESHARDEVQPPAAARLSEGDDRRDQEDLWREKMQQARNRVERARRRYDYLSTLIMVPGKYYVDPESGRSVIRSTEQLQTLSAEARADLEAAEQALADLEERGRRAGVPPGWLR